MWTLVTLVGGFLLKHITFETVKYVAMRVWEKKTLDNGIVFVKITVGLRCLPFF